ncbi:MAG TPA: hypothetical protein VGI81_07575 [Tepidisphaeraceae bacterium]
MKTSQAPELRARDAVANTLIDLLQVPTIYFDAPWPTPHSRVDLLVIDRAGAGDVHVVQIAKDLNAVRRVLPQLMKIPAQFRWVSYVAEDLNSDLEGALTEYARVDKVPLFSPQGMGRIGVILVTADEGPHGEHLSGEIAVRAERFPGSYYDEADKFVKKHKPDILFR